MSIYRAQVAFAQESGLPEDVITNTFHFTSAAPLVAADLGDLADAIEGFYKDPNGVGDAIQGYFGAPTDQGGHEITIYDLADPKPRVPVLSRVWALGLDPTAAAYPAEVACCLSYAAAPVSGQSQARRRGRLFIGPLKATAGTADANGQQRPTAALISCLNDAAVRLQAEVQLNVLNTDWVVYSPTANTSAVVESAWVDNAFDTVRSRGPAPTTKTTIVV